ncbi:NADH dehydrogenase [ubiquinone] complex I, assembly factor 7 [Phlyctochytrium planicorne]|nr:NADH dehydrogenase [ubiquinone] complex I, assembly factor 7 [Phlyctochytrium planicorne]
MQCRLSSNKIVPTVKKEPVTELTKHMMDMIRVSPSDPVESLMFPKLSGPISISQYMRQALTHPLGGYYMKQDVFGSKGDFITSPEISQMFGESYKQFKDFKSTITSVHLVEASPHLRKIQAQKLGVTFSGEIQSGEVYKDDDGLAFRWHDFIEEVGTDGTPFIVGHEYLDALPVFKFSKAADGWKEILVDIDDDAFSQYNFRLVKSKGATLATTSMLNKEKFAKFRDGDTIELSPEVEKESQRVAKLVKEANGTCLWIDYGNDFTDGDTLRGIHKHVFTSFLSTPGECDITANVDFSLVREASSAAGIRFLTQAYL